MTVIRPETRAKMDSLAEHVADGGSMSTWAKANALTQQRAGQLWAKIRAGLGWQAQ